MNKTTVVGAASYCLALWVLNHWDMDAINFLLAFCLVFTLFSQWLAQRQKESARLVDRVDS